MKLLKPLTLLVLVAGAVVAGPVAAAGDAAAGKAKSATCAACHGADGNSAVGMYPKLAGQGEKYLAKQLHDFKSGKRANGIMMGMAMPLSDQDIADLAAYFAAQKHTTNAADPALVKQGETLFRGGNLKSGVPACSGCHGPTGRGNALAGYPALRGQHAEYVEIQLRAFRAAARGDLGVDHRKNDGDGTDQGMMQNVAHQLSDTEVKAVAAFVSGLYQ